MDLINQLKTANCNQSDFDEWLKNTSQPLFGIELLFFARLVTRISSHWFNRNGMLFGKCYLIKQTINNYLNLAIRKQLNIADFSRNDD